MRARKNPDLHGFVPDAAADCLLLVDVINALDFEGGATLARRADRLGARLSMLKARARHAGVPVVYANDNFGRWRSDLREVLRHAVRPGAPGAKLSRQLAPEPDDYVVLKPKHSAFYATTLPTLLDYLGARRVVIAGLVTDACISFTAMDAYLRDYVVCVPADGTIAASAAVERAALSWMRRVLKAQTPRCASLRFQRFSRRAKKLQGREEPNAA